MQQHQGWRIPGSSSTRDDACIRMHRVYDFLSNATAAAVVTAESAKPESELQTYVTDASVRKVVYFY